MPRQYNLQAPPKEVGERIPSDSAHAVSVTLPTWDSNVAYEEGEEWVLSKMRSGYPRYLSYLSKHCIDFSTQIQDPRKDMRGTPSVDVDC